MSNPKVFGDGTMTIVLGPVEGETLPRIRVYAGPHEIRMAFHLKLEANLDNGMRNVLVSMSSLCGVDDLDLAVEQNVRLLSALKWVDVLRQQIPSAAASCESTADPDCSACTRGKI
jgi:hypothetical protein